jgi:hypothetical protein
MMPYWLFAVLIVSHLLLFALGAMAYHGVRMLAASPLYRPKGQTASQSQVKQLADEMLRKSFQMSNPFAHLDGMEGPPPRPRETYIPEGDGKSKEETFAPMAKK